MSQQVFLFMNWGDGWVSLTSHVNSMAALAGLSCRWGVDTPDEQPDPAVLSFRVLDRTGDLAGRAATLAGARVLLQLSESPRWSSLPSFTYDSSDLTWSKLPSKYTPDIPDVASASAQTLFDGIVSTGGEVRPVAGGWMLSLTASSRMIVLKRLSSKGPTNTAAKYKGLHWVGSPAERVAEINKRARAANAPTVDTTGLELPPNVAPYDDSDFPSLLDLLHRLYAHSGRMLLWCEKPSKTASVIGYTALADPVTIGTNANGDAYTTVDGERRDAVDGSRIPADESYIIPEPVTQITLTCRSVKKNSDNVLEIGDTQTVYGDGGLLPANLKNTQSAITRESDVITSDESGGTWGGVLWSPTSEGKATASAWLYAVNMRLRAQNIVFDSRRVEPAERPELYRTCPSGPLVITNATAARLVGDDGKPAFTGAWTTIGGTLTFDWEADEPVLRHETTIWPLPVYSAVKWSDLSGWTATYDDVEITWADLSIMSPAAAAIAERTPV
ncbi:hypothetical protein [Bifidobacterium biavatii]|uniref:Uncharacterized protein n=1 Tax=Bifidobacterium biavatii DSM 23969 TaxID=1437608 RepID=A0A087A1I5_9BIFI|nr:hypothetical protein [Bifidobacterium biavatii]KFI52635.1 hypothetical protein BBIA_0316 [Bifidobacterium biavatii DSM 23969]